jgi:hypothetical protein
MSDLRDAILTRLKREKGFEANRIITKAELIKVDGAVKVVDRPGFCWAREYGQHGGVFQVFNPSTSAQNHLVVKVAYDPKAPHLREVIGVDWETYGVWGTAGGNFPYLPEHGESHERYDGHYGSDPVDVFLRMLYPLRCELNSALTVQVAPLVYQAGGLCVRYAGITSLSVAAHVPGTSGKARKVLVYLDTASNTVKTVAGALGSSATGAALPYPAIPAGSISSCYVRLQYAQTALVETTDFEDARMLLAAASATITAATANTLPCCGA